MAAISDAVVIGIVLGLVFAAVSYYLYSRMTQLERKVGLMENILLDLKVTTEQTLLAAESTELPNQSSPSYEDLSSYQSAMEHAVSGSSDEEQDASENSHPNDEESRDVFLEQTPRVRSPQPSVQVERSEKSNVTLNYEAMTYKELTALGKQYGISGLRNLSKAQVIEALRKHHGSSNSQQPQQTELSSWTSSGVVNFTESNETPNELNELDAMADKTMDNIATLDDADIDGSLVQ